MFIPQNIADLKVISYKVFIFDFGFKISGDLNKPGWFFKYYFMIHASAFVTFGDIGRGVGRRGQGDLENCAYL